MSIKEILQLPPADRLEIAEQIWDSMSPEDISVTDAQKAELNSRMTVDKKGRMIWYSMEEMKERLENKWVMKL